MAAMLLGEGGSSTKRCFTLQQKFFEEISIWEIIQSCCLFANLATVIKIMAIFCGINTSRAVPTE